MYMKQKIEAYLKIRCNNEIKNQKKRYKTMRKMANDLFALLKKRKANQASA